MLQGTTASRLNCIVHSTNNIKITIHCVVTMGLAQHATHIKKSNQPSLSRAYFVHAKQHQTQNHLEAAAWNAQQHRESWPTLVKTKKQGLKQNKLTLAVLHHAHRLTAQHCIQAFTPTPGRTPRPQLEGCDDTTKLCPGSIDHGNLFQKHGTTNNYDQTH